MLRSQALKWEMEHMSHESKSFLPTQLLKSIRQNPHLVPRICATHGLSFTVSKYKPLLFPKEFFHEPSCQSRSQCSRGTSGVGLGELLFSFALTWIQQVRASGHPCPRGDTWALPRCLLDLWMWPGPSFYQGLLLSTSLPHFTTLRFFHGAKIPPTDSPGL